MQIPQQLLVYELHSGSAVKRFDLALAFHVGQLEQGKFLGASPQDHPAGFQLPLLSQYAGGHRCPLRTLYRAVPEVYHLCAGAARRQRFRPICD